MSLTQQGHALADKRKGECQRLGPTVDRMALFFGQIEHHVDIMANITRWQTIQRHTGHAGQHVGAIVRVLHGLRSHILKHDAFKELVDLFKIDIDIPAYWLLLSY